MLKTDFIFLAILRLSNLITEIALHGSPILKYPYERAQKRDRSSAAVSHADPNRLLICGNLLRKYYDYILSLPASEFSHLPGAIWGHMVASIILGLRLSFPIPNETCPSWDHRAARQTIQFGNFLATFSGTDESGESVNLAPASTSSSSGNKSTSTDVLSAMKVVVDMVRRKYEKRLAASELAEAIQQPPHHPGLADLDKSANKCPMLDGSLDQYIQDWDDRFFDPTGLPNSVQGVPALETPAYGATLGTESQPLAFHDLWATMTMGWSQDGFGSVDFGDT